MNYTLQNHFLTKIGRFFTRTTAAAERTENTNFFHLNHIHQFDIIKIAKADGLVIGTTDKTTTQELLQIIRSANQRMVYLKPVFLSSLALYESLKYQVDGWYQPSELQQLTATAASINQRVKDLESDATNRDVKSNVLRKTVQYLYTRGKSTLVPYASEATNMNYAFPFVNNLLPTNKSLEAAQILETGVIEEWLEKEVIDTINIGVANIEINKFNITFAGEQLAKFGYYIRPKTIGLPEGILGLVPFQKLVQQELAHVQQNQHQSFLLELGLIQKNLSFLSPKAQEELALDCLIYLQKNGVANAKFGFTPSNKLWLLLPDFSEAAAIATAKKAFADLQKILQSVLDASQSLLELNMYKMQDCLPEIK